ncbi:allantoinase AllB [Agromyces italicus]|uniref:allantoinase AllB n=1 Tax=Agromyces italicus TaxID=279572 RepID=UPI0003B75181|nr:allantoinase AllB [Agromyces italicus]
MRIVVAPDKFKGSLTAPEVAQRVAAGLRSVDPGFEIVTVPVADGGEGTLDAAVAAGFELRTAKVTGPTGAPVEAAFAVRGTQAVIEMARASGLDLLPGGRPDPLGASSRGTGELVRAALDAGCRELVLGIGGSASSDGGAGLLQGLGARLTDASGAQLPGGGGALSGIAEIDLSGLDPRLAAAQIVLASDVDNPLLGADGAAAVFGPQKGASAADVAALDAALARFVEVLDGVLPGAGEAAVEPGAGAAGGVGFAAIAVLGAVRRPGIDVVLEFTGLAGLLVGADAVVTGEGSLDAQSLMGKTPVGVARAAAAAGVPAYAVSGRSELGIDELSAAGFAWSRSLAELEPDAARSIAGAGELLERLAAELGREFASGAGPEASGTRFDRVLRAERALVDGRFTAAEIGVMGGVVTRIAPLGTALVGDVIEELAADEVLIPGLVDTHVHVNEPGRTEWEGFASATRAAAAGGVTTIIDMPLNSIPPTVSVAALDEKRAAAAGQTFVDVGFWGGVIPGNLDELEPLVGEGVFGFKCFLLHSGVDEFPQVTADEMEQAMRVIAAADSLLVVHAEDAHVIDAAPHTGGPGYADFLASRPHEAEDRAIADVIERATRTGARAHVLHLSSADSIGQIAAAKAAGTDLSVETCPHYLTLFAEDVPAGATAFKCCPPIREDANRDALWQGLADGVIDFIVSDHSPSTPELKYAGDGDFELAWGGIASLQLGLPLIWTEARARGIALERVVEWMSAKPAERVGLTTKGRITEGGAADFAVFAPDETFTVDAASLEHRHPVTPYDGRELQGAVRRAYLAGAPIDRERAQGRMLRKGNA